VSGSVHHALSLIYHEPNNSVRSCTLGQLELYLNERLDTANTPVHESNRLNMLCQRVESQLERRMFVRRGAVRCTSFAPPLSVGFWPPPSATGNFFAHAAHAIFIELYPFVYHTNSGTSGLSRGA
jgi:hypothetical protein